MTISLRKFAIAAAALATAAAPAFASSWAVRAENPETAQPVVIYSDDATEPGMLISCTNGKLNMFLGLEAIDFSDMRSSRRTRNVDVTVSIEGRETFESSFLYYPQLETVLPTDFSTKAKLYNAAIQGQSITIDVPKKGTIAISTPEIDDNFRAFAAGCDVTSS